MSASTNPTFRPLFRVIVPLFAPNNIFSGAANKTVSLAAVVIATVANKFLPWLDVEVIDENNYRSKRRGPTDREGHPDHQALQRERPATFVGLCCSMTNAMPRALALAKFYSDQPGILGIIAGGWHVHYEPAEILKAGATAVVHGEGEAVICQLLQALYNHQPINGIPGISYWQDGSICRNGPEQLLTENLDELPHPDFGLVRFAQITMYPVSRIRGCSGRCEFCSVRGRPRFVSPEKFLDNFKVLISQGARKFFLVDDRTEQDRAGSLKFFNALGDFCREKKIPLDITVQVRLSLAEDTELLLAMKKAGVNTVCIGYESPIVAELKAMKKPINQEKMLAWTNRFKKIGFFIHAMMIFGYPLLPEQREKFQMSARERANEFWRFIKKASRAGVDTLQILLLTPLLGTEVRERLAQEGRLLNLGWEYYDGTWLLFLPDSGVDPVELQHEVVRLMRKFYAFSLLWPMKYATLVAHLVRIGFVTIWLPAQYFYSGFNFRPWYNRWRNALIRFGAHLIIIRWLKNFRKSNFLSKLTRAKQAR